MKRSVALSDVYFHYHTQTLTFKLSYSNYPVAGNVDSSVGDSTFQNEEREWSVEGQILEPDA